MAFQLLFFSISFSWKLGPFASDVGKVRECLRFDIFIFLFLLRVLLLFAWIVGLKMMCARHFIWGRYFFDISKPLAPGPLLPLPFGEEGAGQNEKEKGHSGITRRQNQIETGISLAVEELRYVC